MGSWGGGCQDRARGRKNTLCYDIVLVKLGPTPIALLVYRNSILIA